MKKSTLALSVAAAIGGFGFVGSASAITTVSGADATSLAVNSGGIGHKLLFPYFSAQGNNATLINITNSDTVNGKLVKVRFRGAGNSDDLYDFQLLLSPGDVFTGSITQATATSGASFSSSDTSCVVPSGAKNNTFLTTRVDPAGDVNAQTREGYIEVLNMADIRPATTLFGLVKHTTGKPNTAPTCTDTNLDPFLGTDVADVTAAQARGMEPPTGGLSGDWVILNQSGTVNAAWSGAATALRATKVVAGLPVNAMGNLVFWPQKDGVPSQAASAALLRTVTADELLVQNLVAAGTRNYDLPDLSTPYVVGDLSAADRADKTTYQLAITSLKHQFAADTSATPTFVTDLVISQPTRRYSVGVNYKASSTGINNIATSGTSASAVYRVLTAGALPVFYNSNNTALGTGTGARQVCLTTISAPSIASLYDREETTPTSGTSPFVISPANPGSPDKLQICGEASVVTLNQKVEDPSAALGGTVARSNVNFISDGLTWTTGWANWNITQATDLGLPILGATFMRVRNATSSYGFAFPHKYTW